MRVRPPVGRSRVAIVGLLVGLVAIGGWWRWSSPERGAVARAVPVSAPKLPVMTTVPPTTVYGTADPGDSNLRVGRAHPVGSPALIADAIGAQVPLFSQPGDTEPGDVVDNPTWEGLPVAGLVMQQRGDWIEIQISRRPNEATAWVKAADFKVRETPYKIRVDSSEHRLTLTERATTLMDITIANGTGGTPTPTGTFFLDGIVKLRDPTGPYGTHQLSVTAFSDVLTSFSGGVGQIALHGTNSPGLLGGSVSHGCVRMSNQDVTRLASLAPVGTPVEIYE